MKAHFLRKFETPLGFALYLNKRFTCCKQIPDQRNASVPRKDKITIFVCNLKCTAQQLASCPNMFHSGDKISAKMQIDSGLKAYQLKPLDQLITDLGKAKCSLMIAKPETCDQA